MADVRTVGTGPPAVEISVVGRFAVLGEGHPLPARPAGERLLALLALHGRTASRPWVAGVLWGDSDEAHAASSLRSTLHRLPRRDGRPLVRGDGDRLRLDPSVVVDLDDCTQLALALATDETAGADLGLSSRGALVAEQVQRLSLDVLPDWYDEWVVGERERHRHLRLHALESMSRRLTVAGRYALALQAGLTAVAAEPLRESAHRVVVEAHLAEGNRAEAVRQVRRCAAAFEQELGIRPSTTLQRLVHDDRRT